MNEQTNVKNRLLAVEIKGDRSGQLQVPRDNQGQARELTHNKRSPEQFTVFPADTGKTGALCASN